MGEIPTASPESGDSLDRAKAIVQFRGKRAKIFSGKADLFSDPAWDMLLDLFIAAKTDRLITVSSLCIAAQAPSTTALRWINVMIGSDLLVRTPDPSDARKVLVSLTDLAMASMEELLS